MVLSTVCAAKARPDIDFFPLTVEYREKNYAAGKFPGGYMKREGRPSNKEILTCRLIDRPVRPLWPDGYRDEVQLINLVVSVDKENDPDVVAMNGSFAALHLAPLPFLGPIAAVRVSRVDGELVAFPTLEQIDKGDLDLIVVCSREAIVMVEGVAFEIPENEFLDALDYANDVCETLMDLMDELREKSGAKDSTWEPKVVEHHKVFGKVKNDYAKDVRKALLVQGKHERAEALSEIKADAIDRFVDRDDEDAKLIEKEIGAAFNDLKSEQIRDLILSDSKRIDLRGLEDVRPIDIEAAVLPRSHGSALFTRGETQALVNVTLGTPRDQQIVDGIMEEYSKRLDLHYNFPPFSVGEVRMMRGISRREIGHGTLAERALSSIIPDESVFPYALRIVSEITESNGSSSMATVCGGTLALMDAGVPIRQPVAGIAMGLVAEGDRVAILSDILGTEDHVGDMDFKVAGTGRGITAVQMDIKIKGLKREIMEDALEQARRGRLHILREMIKAIDAPRAEISEHAPRLLQLRISPEKIGLVIGPGGKTIKRIQEETGANVEIDDEGIVSISSTQGGAAEEARQFIEHLTAEVEVGAIYEGRVVSIKDFGCFVEVLPGQEGLCHVSELDHSHVNEVSDVVSIGDRVKVKVILRDEQGRLKLSRRAAMDEEGGGGRRPRHDDGEGGGDEDDRPRRPRRRREEGDDRPRRRDDGERSGRRDDGDRPRRRDDGDRPRRSRDDDDRPRRPRRRDDDERPRGDRDRGDRPPRRDRGDRGERGDRPPRDDDRSGPRRRPSRR